MYVNICLHIFAQSFVCGNPKKALDPLELELQRAVSFYVVLGTELRSAAKIPSVLND